MDLKSKMELGAAMFGSPNINIGASRASAEVVSDSKDGEVIIVMKDNEGTSQEISVSCDGDLRQGDVATIIIQDGIVTALSAGGAGERTKKETEAAKNAADSAQIAADNADENANQAKDAAASAQDSANTAQSTAENAQSSAATAQNTANTAKSAAATAQSTANTAKTAAATAQSTANTAKSAATTAQSTANSAQSAASTAQSTANTAKSAAATAQSTANAAQSSANEAQATAKAASEKAQATANYFWHDTNGAHVSTTEGSVSTGSNMLLTSEKMSLCDGSNELAKFSTNEVSLNQGRFQFSSDVTSAGVTINKIKGTAKNTNYTHRLQLYSMDAGGDSLILESEKNPSNKYLSITIGEWQQPPDVTINSREGLFAGNFAFENLNSSSQLDINTDGFFARNESSEFHASSDMSLNTDTTDGITYIGNSKNALCLEGSSISINNTNILLLAYPVGSIYMSTNSTSPATLFGGTWQALDEGRVLIGANSSYKAGTTGGSNTHTHTLSHTHTLTHTHQYGLRMGAHYSSFVSSQGSNSFDLWNGTAWQKSGSGASDQVTIAFNKPVAAATGTTSKTISRPSKTCATGAASSSTTSAASTSNTGSSSNMMAYLSVYMWKRTA